MNKEEKEKNREEWRCRVEEWRASGLTQVEYCRRNDLKTSKLVYWSKKFSDECLKKTGFVEVPLRTPTAFCPIRIGIDNRYFVEVGNGYDPGALEHIIGILSRM